MSTTESHTRRIDEVEVVPDEVDASSRTTTTAAGARPRRNKAPPAGVSVGMPLRTPAVLLGAVLLIVFGTGSAVSATVDFEWAVAGGGRGPDDADGVGVDRRGRVTISGGVGAASEADIFATGYSPEGRVRWSRRFGGPGADQAYDNDVDSKGNALVTGSFNGTVDFDGKTVTSQGRTQERYGDAFLLKLGPRGGARWVRQIGGVGSDGGDEVAVGPAGSAFVTGDSDKETQIEGRVLSPTGGRDAWAARYTKAGRLRWARRLGGTGDQRSHGISTDREGRALVTGEMSGASAFDSRRLQSVGSRPDVYVAKLGKRGGVRWARGFGGEGRQIGRGVDADRRGNVYFGGEFEGSMRLGSATLTSAGGDDAFLAKADGRGRVKWAIGLGGTGDEVGPEVEVDGRGNSYLTGSFSGTARFGDHTLTASGARAAYTAKLSPNGRVEWVVGSGAGPFATLGELALGPGSVSVLGRFVAEVTLGGFELTGAGGTDYFLARLPR